MMSANKLMSEVAELPVEQRVLVADSILRGLHSPEPEIEKLWTATASRRLEEIQSGKVVPVNGDEVLSRLVKRVSK